MGQLRSAVSYIADKESGGIFYPDKIDKKTGGSVESVLLSKRPLMQDPGVKSLVDFELLPEFIDISIMAETMETVASKLSSGAGLSGFDSAALKNLLLVHGQASKHLLVAFAKFIE